MFISVIRCLINYCFTGLSKTNLPGDICLFFVWISLPGARFSKAENLFIQTFFKAVI